MERDGQPRDAIAAASRGAAAGDECAPPPHLGIHAGDVIGEENPGVDRVESSGAESAHSHP
jgi:hypothetical protein